MTIQEKINLINTLHSKVVDSKCDGEVCLCVLAIVDDETRAVLKQLGKDDQWINLNAVEDDDSDNVLIDITHVGFEFANWWDEGNGFCEEPIAI